MEKSDFFEKLKSITHAYPKNVCDFLEIEILESSFISNFEKMKNVIEKCNGIGIAFLLDDFGTKYSAINYLINLPFKYLKVDVEFIRNVVNNEKNTKILMAILDIAEATNMQVIVEGVETQKHLDYLVNIGCVFGQGYAISKPMPSEEFPSWYQTWNAKRKENFG